MTDSEKTHIRSCFAEKIAGWIKERGGVALWGSANLSDPSYPLLSPANNMDGTETPKPNWRTTDKPIRIIKKAEEIIVDVPQEVKRFRITIHMGRQGLSLKCTVASTRKIHREIEKAGKDSWYEFDYGTQECVIYRPEKMIPLEEYVKI